MALRFDELSPREFEELCAALLRAKNHQTRHLGAGGSERGWDVESTDPDGRLWCVQCKRVKSLNPGKAVRELTKVLNDPKSVQPEIWALMASTDVTRNVQEKLVEAADGRCEIRCFGPTDLEGWTHEHARIRDRFFAGREPHARIAYVSAVKADRDVAAELRRDLQLVLRRHWEAAWNVAWHDPTEDGLPEIPEAASVAFVVVSPEALADRALMGFWKSAICQGHRAGRRKLFALSVAPTVPWPDWLTERFERRDLRLDSEDYRIDLSAIISKWIGKTESELRGELVAGPGSPAIRLDADLHGRLVDWLEPVMERDLSRRFLAVGLGLDGMNVLDDFPTDALRASAAVVLGRRDDDPVRAAERLIRVVREALKGEESRERLQVLDGIERDLSARQKAEPEAVERGLLPAWLKRVRDDHERLVDHFQVRHELDFLDKVYVELEMLPDHLAEHRLMDGGGLSEKGRQLGGRQLSIRDILALGPEDFPWVTRRWVVRGDPGAGKTTLLRHLASRLAAERERGWVPVFQSLPVLVRSKQSLLDRVDEAFEEVQGRSGLKPVLEREGQEGRLLVLLDGLDEVGQEDRARAEDQLRRLSDRWPETPIVVSTRPIGYRRFSPDFRELQILPLSRERRLGFLAAWFGRADDRVDTDRAETALRQLEASGLDELAGNPLYLTLMAILLEQDKAPDKNRSKLYDQVFTLLLEGKHKHEQTEPVERPALVRKILRLLAYTLTEDNRDSESKADLQERLYHEQMHGLHEELRRVPRWDGPLSHFLEDLAERVGILGPHDGEDADWRFWHRTFKEALTAEHLAQMKAEDLLARAASLGGEESRWAEPFALLTGQVEEPDALVKQLVDTNKTLGLRALATAQGVSDATLDEILALTDDPDARTEVFEQIPGQLQDPERSLQLIDRLRRRTRNGSDLFWLYDAAEAVAGQSEDWVEPARDLQARFFDHIAVPDPALFRRFRTAEGEDKELWCEIPKGTYWVGSPEDEEGRTEHDGDEIRHRVELARSYWMAAIPVTNAQYAAFDPGIPPHRWDSVPKESDPDFPRVKISWWEAVSFCRWLASRGGLTGARLPWDAEWEVACRGGSDTTYWSGDTEEDLERVGWYDKNADGRAHRVAEKPANAFGLYDAHGNVWEGIQDTDNWEAFKTRPTDGLFAVDPADPPADLAASPRASRVIRGGSFLGSARDARSAFRFNWVPWYRGLFLGFRVLLPFAPSDP